MFIRNKTRISAAFIVAGFVVAGLSLGATHLSAAGDSPTTLDQWLAQAMDKNSGILASKAKVAMAEAELRNVRFEVARQVVACWNEIDQQQRAIALAGEKEGAVAKGVLIDLKAKLARAQSELQFLGGQAPPATLASLAPSSTAAMVQAPLQIPHGPMVEKVRKALREPAKIEFVETPLKDVVEYLKDSHHIEIQLDGQYLREGGVDESTPLIVNLKGVSLGAAMQYLDDTLGTMKFVVREYGILLTTPSRAQEAGYMSVVEFARLDAGAESAGKGSEAGGSGAAISKPYKATPKPAAYPQGLLPQVRRAEAK